MILGTFSLAANAQVVTDELEELEPKNNSSVEKVHVESTHLLKKEHAFATYYLPSSNSFNQDGEGQNYATENGSGQGIYLSLSKALSDFQKQIDINLLYQRAQFAEPDDIGGENIQTSRFLFNTSFSWKFETTKSDFAVGAGGTLQLETADSFSDNNKLMSNNLALGPAVNLKWDYHLFEKFTVGVQALMTLPLYIQEHGKKTGYYKNGYHLLTGLLLNYSLTKNLAASIGVLTENQQRTFEGDGERGVTDAKTSFASVSFPLGMIYEY